MIILNSALVSDLIHEDTIDFFFFFRSPIIHLHHLKMLTLQGSTMAPLKGSKRSAAAASKVKNKMLSKSKNVTELNWNPNQCQTRKMNCKVILLNLSLLFNTKPDTSSFFRVSLKTNNKALAVALQAQKERRQQLELEVMGLHKQLQSLCFELATRKYKDRKMVCSLTHLTCLRVD